MERDFLRLRPYDCVVVKEEFAVGGCEESGFARSSGFVPWPLPMSNFPHFMSQKPEPEEKPLKMKATVLPTLDINKNPSVDVQNPGGTTMMQQVPGDNNYLTAPASNHTSSVGDVSNPSNSGAQFTIFYDGTVHVFDDVSPEKAQAIIFLAGNGSVRSNVTQSKYQMEADKPLLSRNQSMNLSSHFSTPSNPVVDVSAAPNSNAKLSPIGSFAANAMIPSAVPQSRKASLARFLEKRRGRQMNASPCGTSRKPNDVATPNSTRF